MPVVNRAPIWRDPSPESKRRGKCPHGRPVGGDASDDEEDAESKSEVKQKLKNQISRHRDDVSSWLLGCLWSPLMMFCSGSLLRRHLCTGKLKKFADTGDRPAEGNVSTGTLDSLRRRM
jgi:hypothetical protein